MTAHGFPCGDCGRWLDTRTALTHDCYPDDYDGPDDYDDAAEESQVARMEAAHEALVYGDDGAS